LRWVCTFPETPLDASNERGFGPGDGEVNIIVDGKVDKRGEVVLADGDV